jgi:hypothetical protein
VKHADRARNFAHVSRVALLQVQPRFTVDLKTRTKSHSI